LLGKPAWRNIVDQPAFALDRGHDTHREQPEGNHLQVNNEGGGSGGAEQSGEPEGDQGEAFRC
jgi:hypothetical protein